jgi:hypothetical protein
MRVFQIGLRLFQGERSRREKSAECLLGSTLSKTVEAAVLGCVSSFVLGVFCPTDCLLVELSLRRLDM